MPEMTCQQCATPNAMCQPRVCNNCHTRIFRCHDCADVECRCGANAWLCLSECNFDLRNVEPEPKKKRTHDDALPDDAGEPGDGDADELFGVAHMILGGGEKMTLEAFLAELEQLTSAVAALCPEEGLPYSEVARRLDAIEAQRQNVLAILSGPSAICGVDDGGIAHLIETHDACLLHAADVLRTARAQLDAMTDGDMLHLGSPYPTEACQARAVAGETIVRWWKIYRSYAAIWTGAKWRRAQLAKEVKQGNPIAQLSKRNVAAIKRELCRDEFMRKNRRKLAYLDEFITTQDDIKALRRRLARLQDEEPPADRRTVEKLRRKIGRRLARLQNADACHTMLESELADFNFNGFGLADDEHALFAALLGLPYKLKHATNAWYCIQNDGRLDSYTEIKRKSPEWQSEFSTGGNIDALGNGGFVFFRLDVGLDDIQTRYGGTLITYDIGLLGTHGWVSLYDQLKPLSSPTMKYLYDQNDNLIRTTEVCGTGETGLRYCYGKAPRQSIRVKTKDPLAAPRFRSAKAKTFDDGAPAREVSFLDLVFHGGDIPLGITLAVIRELRHLRKCGFRAQVLSDLLACSAKGAASDGSTLSERQKMLAHLLSRLFRPEGKYPVALRLSRHPPQVVARPEGDGRYLEDSTENPEVMADMRLEARRKEIEARLHVTRQQTGAAEKRATSADQEGDADKAQIARAKATAWRSETATLSAELEQIKARLDRKTLPSASKKTKTTGDEAFQ